jgi:hypothetical protein
LKVEYQELNKFRKYYSTNTLNTEYPCSEERRIKYKPEGREFKFMLILRRWEGILPFKQFLPFISEIDIPPE